MPIADFSRADGPFWKNTSDSSLTTPVVETESLLEAKPAPTPKGSSLLAWLVIIAVVMLIVSGLHVRYLPRPSYTNVSTGPSADLIIFEIQARQILGLSKNLGANQAPGTVYGSISQLNGGSLDQRLRCAVLFGELIGPKDALDQIDHLREQLRQSSYTPNKNQANLLDILNRLYLEYKDNHWDAPAVTSKDREQLRQGLGYFGELALSPEQGVNSAIRNKLLRSAQWSSTALLGVIFVAVTLGIAGFLGLIVLMVRWISGKVKRHLDLLSPYSKIYAETFALWLVLFFVFSLLANYIPGNTTVRHTISAVVSLSSLSALLWPIFRGVPRSQLAYEIGWIFDTSWPKEVWTGIKTYITTLPLLFLSLPIMLGLMRLQQHFQTDHAQNGVNHFTPSGMPAHPVVEWLATSNIMNKILVVLLAVVVAPIVEEIMFRGVFYRHVRQSSKWLGSLGSVIFSMLLVSFLFAVIHPQGMVAIPSLMALAIGFTMARECRNSLIPGIVAHGMNNGMMVAAMCFMI